MLNRIKALWRQCTGNITFSSEELYEIRMLLRKNIEREQMAIPRLAAAYPGWNEPGGIIERAKHSIKMQSAALMKIPEEDVMLEKTVEKWRCRFFQKELPEVEILDIFGGKESFPLVEGFRGDGAPITTFMQDGDGVWFQVVLDLMGDWTKEYVDNWNEKVRSDRATLVAAGARIFSPN